jgi:hypothetical protein
MTATLDPTTATPTGFTVVDPEVDVVPYDPYKDIHKGIRAELFRVTTRAGNLDPAERCARETLAEDVSRLFELLVSHAAHEDDFMQPHIERHAPYFAECIAADHEALEARMVDIEAQVGRAASAPASEQRDRVHLAYRELASFTSAYLAHQDLEERQVMPALAAVMSVDEVMAVDRAIVATIPPEQMGWSLGFMLPAMNLEDRVELLGGMQAGAPPEVFAGVWALAGSVLEACDHAALARRLGLS